MTTLTKIGNSQGIRIPKPIIRQAHLENAEIELEVTSDGLLLRPIRRSVRKGWEANIRSSLTEGKHDEGIIAEWVQEPLDTWEW
jgi:antitoxin MazE